MAPTRNIQEYYETQEEWEEVGQEYKPVHLCYIGIDKFNQDDWNQGDSLFDLFDRIPNALLYKDDEMWSCKGRKNKERSAFAHMFEGDDGGFHHCSEAIGGNGVQTTNKRIVSEKFKVYRVDVIITEGSKTKTFKDRIFFPDAWGRFDVMRSTVEAYRNGIYVERNKFIGKDDQGFPIEFAIDEDFRIKTAYPYFPK
ncbi:EndoU domain-containing protein [Priestia megaterium]|uniref:EndoU domain-containing protein n=1 Tax=Priestia megaterium TaxID=1404 RepID=UPI0021D64F93|nr:EndoU domain-containing protein [Priestia megaterium]MCU7766486.1 EndoU domain-containing protein [Priestia megaterium]